ncbi:MAG: hormogonium polysaccharide biosynthesis protein HpsL [Symplocastrum torsivum CPER-KK1]|jgi:hypothetical protein|uniref:Hormogonium polysaccharide biosynthesis protein HpsL n=1 Tax=Symplocastrum torsivum CPER-KK1 TaxID=450513 RepID=A0A951PLI4_9CYAN|nr:hormogonium polysaccharide biosynthesis protein HpsL [Symplocastrum torsivum CPER-KK1]
MPKLKSKKKVKKHLKSDSTLSLKERLAKKRKAQIARKELIQFLTISVFLAAVLGIVLSLVVGLKAGVAALAIPCLGFAYKYPRQALWFFLFYLPINGTVTYWVGGGNAVFQLAKDAFYLPALIALIQQCQRKKQPILIPKKLMTTLGILLGLSVLTLLFVNGSLQLSGSEEGKTFFQGILGLKVLIGYVPLIFCAYYLIETKKHLLFCTRLHLVMAIACCVLGLMQYFMLVTGVCAGTDHLSGADLFKATLEAKCFVGGALVYSPSQDIIRLPGTFVSPWHWAWFLIANSALTFASAFNDPSLFWRTGGLVGMALVFINAVISGQRIALVLVPIVIAILLILTGQVANLKRFLPIGLGLALVLGIAATTNPTIVQERWDSTVSRWEASPPHAFILGQFDWAINEKPGLLGKGLGRATNSTRIFGETKLVETFHPKLLYEIGLLGLLAFLAFVTHLTMITFKEYRSVRDKSLRSFSSSFWVFVLIISYFPYWYPLDTDPVAVYYWFFAGVILKLPEIDRQELEKLRLVEENELQPKKKRKSKTSRKQTVAKLSS